jgi:DNA-binding winged helix-turn-helix (wHTH) protein
MRSHNSNRVIPDRMESAFIGPRPRTAEPRPACLLDSSSRHEQHRNLAQRMQMPATLRDGIAEVLADIDGLPVLFRVLIKDASAQLQSGFESTDADIHSLLSDTLEKMADRMRRPSPPGDRPSKRRLSIVESASGGEPLADHPVPLSETVLRVGPLQLDLLDRTARRGDRKIDLRPREFQLLRYMMQQSDKLLTRAMLFKDVWNYRFVPETNLVDVHMGRLRRKVDGPNEAPMIRNVRGSGFVLSATPVFQDSPTVTAERSVNLVAGGKSPQTLEQTLQ